MADIYLAADDDLLRVTFGGRVFGTGGKETVTYMPTVTGVTIDQNVDRVSFLADSYEYAFQQQGNQLVIYAGAVVVARIAVQGDEDGTELGFDTDTPPGWYSAKISAAGMTLGGVTVPTAAPATITVGGSYPVPAKYLTPGVDKFGPSGGALYASSLSADAPATTFTAGDQLLGSEFYDEFVIYTTATENRTFPENATVAIFEVITIRNAGPATPGLTDISKYYGIRQLWQNMAAADVTNLAAGVSAGFRDLDLSGGVNVTTIDDSRSAAIALDAIKPNGVITVKSTTAAGLLDSVTVVAGKFNGFPNNPNTLPEGLKLIVTPGQGVDRLTLNTLTDLSLSVRDSAGAETTGLRLLDASGSLGGVGFDLKQLKASSTITAFDGGSVALGNGADVLTPANGVTISNLRRGAGEDAAQPDGADTIVLTGAVQAADRIGTGYAVKDGLLTFGTAPASLTEALATARTATTADNETLVFRYLGDSYVFAERTNASDADDILIKLAGTTGLAGLDTLSSGNVYVF
ncbi:hypothetical protein [Novosphingobium sp. JCM 18896]|uniref:hypothetical protein n=1 Tax=Novosphingobium sp. JCM 18896 TaxID=2989731 RepID=UPI002223C04E|nr:hypothetical protein [Novosphingobium sp. JCM 18896]MCW1431808.1 hypothetical protein [Novosphingobium sp. JCM 18896]